MQDIPLPEFATEKLEKDWTDEEKKKMKEYEKKIKGGDCKIVIV